MHSCPFIHHTTYEHVIHKRWTWEAENAWWGAKCWECKPSSLSGHWVKLPLALQLVLTTRGTISWSAKSTPWQATLLVAQDHGEIAPTCEPPTSQNNGGAGWHRMMHQLVLGFGIHIFHIFIIFHYISIYIYIFFSYLLSFCNILSRSSQHLPLGPALSAWPSSSQYFASPGASCPREGKLNMSMNIWLGASDREQTGRRALKTQDTQDSSVAIYALHYIYIMMPKPASKSVIFFKTEWTRMNMHQARTTYGI